MSERKLYGTNELVESYISGLTKIETSNGGWTEKYLDRETGQEWLKYWVEFDRSFFFNLIVCNPLPTTDELIEIALTSIYDDEVCAAVTRLYLNERDFNKEYRQQLIDRLSIFSQQTLDNESKKRLQIIIQAGRLKERLNNRVILGKHFSEIQKDAEFFYSIAIDAENILIRQNIE